MKISFIDYLIQRGFYNQCTNDNGLKKLLDKPNIGYIGFDCTANSLHVGSLVPIMLLRAFQKFGHKPIVLLGGGTSLIGDPSGKDETRNILNISKVNSNKNKLTKIFKKFLKFNSDFNSTEIVNNYDWIKKINYLSFIREIGSQFSINRMLSFDSVKLRLQREQNLSFLEFNYALIQSYDFLELFKKKNCKIQFGGSDQWGNIVSGIDLIKKMQNKETFGLTLPLIQTSSGKKMGKTNNGAIWLTEENLSVYEYWQYWRNTADKDVIRFLKLFTDLPLNTINQFKKVKGEKINDAKILLANEATKICHGEVKSLKAENASQNLFVKNTVDQNIPKKNILTINHSELINQVSLKDILIKINLSNSMSESKRLIISGAVKINNERVNNKDFYFKKINLKSKDEIKISVGKKRFGLLKIN